MNLKNSFFLFLTLIFCFNLTAQESETKKYFDLKSFIEEQVESLEKSKPTVEKKTLHNTEKESKKTNKIDWQKELRLFADADINKPILKQAYTVTENPQSIDYQAINTNLKVRNIHIEKENDLVKKLTIHYKESNHLFEIEKKLSLDLNKNNITNYQIEIIQEIIFKDKDHYQVSGKIIQ